MYENHKRKEFVKNKCLIAMATVFLFVGGENALANQNAPVGVRGAMEQQQAQSISGSIVDVNGTPIIGASVAVVGTTNGTITDLEGNFKLTAPLGATLKISFVGYQTQQVKATKNMKIILKEDSEILDEVVVVGYGTQKKENLTGAVASVDVSKTLAGRPIADVGRGLQGSTPGLSIVIPSGEVGSDPLIKIRGQIASINGASSPLILLDNVEIPSIQMVNPDDIESISVLKDAAASSIYGAKAALGVVLITTKKGSKQESVNVSYSGNFSWQNISKKMEMGGLDALEYSVDAFKRVGGTVAGAFVQITEEGLLKAREWEQKYGGKLGPNDPYVYGRDWYVDAENRKIGLRTFDPYDYMIKEWTPSMTHNLSVNGKSGKTSYNIGLGYLNQTGLMKPAKKDDFRRYNGSIKISTDVNKYLTVRAGAIYSKREKRYAYATNSTTADPWLYLYRWGPNMPLGYDDEGNIIRSPHSEVSQANTASRIYNYMNLNIGATVNIMKNWRLDVDYTYASNDYILKTPGTRYMALNSWGGAVAKNDANGNRVMVNADGEVVPANTPGAMPAYKFGMTEYTAHGSNPDHMYRRTENSNQDTWNITTTYDWNLNKNNVFKFMVGMNRVAYDVENSWARKSDLSDISNPQFDLAVGLQEAGGGFDWEGQMGYFGRINYALKDRYLLEANLRYDGTSKFPGSLQWRAFPSFSAGWRASEEAFLKWMTPVVNSLKFRGSWGVIGDQTVANSLYVPTMNTGQLKWLDANGGKLAYVSMPNAVTNSITWQDIATVDFGVDVRVLDNSLGLTFDWYQRDTKNMIVPGAGITYTFGTDAPKGNYGSLRTKGWELAVDYNHRFKNGLGINAMFTLSDAVTEITKYGETKLVNDYYVGKKYGDIWGYETDRLYQKDDFVYNGEDIVQILLLNGKEVPAGTKGAVKVNKLKGDNPVYQDFLQSGNFYFGPGDVKLKDLNGDGRINTGSGTVDNPGDQKVIGNSTPRYEYGFRLGADYKGFDLSVFFQGVGKRKIWGSGFLAIAGFNSSDGAIPQAIAGDYWREDRTDAFYPSAYNLAGSNNSLNMVTQSRYLLDMSYLRMKNITVGYTLPTDILRKVFIQKARVYLSLENFVTWDHLRGLPIDPEVISGYSMYNSDNYNSGRTGVGTPTFKSLSVGLQLNF